MSEVPVIATELPDGSRAVHHPGRFDMITAGYDGPWSIALVDLTTWANVTSSTGRVLDAYVGRRIPGSTAGGVGARPGQPDLADWLPADYDGAPPGVIDSPVRWYAPPHPLALTDEEVSRIVEDCEQWQQSERNTTRMAVLGWENARASRMRIQEVIAVANAMGLGGTTHAKGPVQVLEYLLGDGIDWHNDQYVASDDFEIEWEGAERSVIIQLSDPADYTGGDVQFLLAGETRPLTLPRARGTIAVFRSEVEHRVAPIHTGRRLSVTGFLR